MALKIKKQLPTGIDAEYWNIAEINCNSSGANIVMSGFLNQSARNAGKERIDVKFFTVDIDIKTYDKKLIEEAYKKVKTDKFFEGAQDV